MHTFKPTLSDQVVARLDDAAKQHDAAHVAALEKRVRDLETALRQMVDLAEFWINREDRREYSEQQFKTWHALGHGSNAMREARAAIAAAEAQLAAVGFFPTTAAWNPLAAAAAPTFTNIIQSCTCGRSGGTDCGKEGCPYAKAEAQPAEQEPVAWRRKVRFATGVAIDLNMHGEGEPLYTHSQPDPAKLAAWEQEVMRLADEFARTQSEFDYIDSPNRRYYKEQRDEARTALEAKIKERP